MPSPPWGQKNVTSKPSVAKAKATPQSVPSGGVQETLQKEAQRLQDKASTAFNAFLGREEPEPEAPSREEPQRVPPRRGLEVKPFFKEEEEREESVKSVSEPQEGDRTVVDEAATKLGEVALESGTVIGAGVAGAAVGSVLADAAVFATNSVTLTGELLADAAAVGAVALGGAAVYAAVQPDEAGQLARKVGKNVADGVGNQIGPYMELAQVKAELAILEQQQRLINAIDGSSKEES